MYLLYVDESGDGGLSTESSKHLVLAGAAMHEGQWNKLTVSLDALQDSYFPQAGNPIEFHASDIRSRRKNFRDMAPAHRTRLLNDGYGVISGTRQGLVLFAAVIDKRALMYKYSGKVDPYGRAFEEHCVPCSTISSRPCSERRGMSCEE